MKVEHDMKSKKFFIKVEGKEAELLYRDSGDGVLDFYSTYVPEEARGLGLAGKLVAAGIDYAKDNKLKIKPTCSYVVSYFEKRDEFKELKV